MSGRHGATPAALPGPPTPTHPHPTRLGLVSSACSSSLAASSESRSAESTTNTMACTPRQYRSHIERNRVWQEEGGGAENTMPGGRWRGQLAGQQEGQVRDARWMRRGTPPRGQGRPRLPAAAQSHGQPNPSTLFHSPHLAAQVPKLDDHAAARHLAHVEANLLCRTASCWLGTAHPTMQTYSAPLPVCCSN